MSDLYKLVFPVAVGSFLLGAVSASIGFSQSRQAEGYILSEVSKTIVDGLICQDGTSVREHSHHLHHMKTSSLLSLGEDGRATLKSCLCEGFQSNVCAALKMEIIDDAPSEGVEQLAFAN